MVLRPIHPPPTNPQENAIIDRINQVLGNLLRKLNLQEKYVADAEPWMGILEEAAFTLQ